MRLQTERLATINALSDSLADGPVRAVTVWAYLLPAITTVVICVRADSLVNGTVTPISVRSNPLPTISSVIVNIGANLLKVLIIRAVRLSPYLLT